MRYSERLADLDSCGHFVTFDEMAIAVSRRKIESCVPVNVTLRCTVMVFTVDMAS